MKHWRVVVFAAVCIGCVIAVVAAFGQPSDDAPAVAADSPQIAEMLGGPFVAYRRTAVGPQFGRLALAPSGTPDERTVTDLHCERSYITVNGGVCVEADRGLATSFKAILLDGSLNPVWEQPLAGTSSRNRVSADGRYAAITTFVSGDSYATESFSTRTVILDLAARQLVDDLEQFTIVKDDQPITPEDRNFWGVTFAADSNRFYATMSTGGEFYLVEGDVLQRQMNVLRSGVECPSLSPDGTRVAFKKRLTDGGGQVEWRLSVLDLATLTELPTAEVRSVDDQAEWLDDHTLLYGLPRVDAGEPTSDIWAVPADGSGQAQLFEQDASSPAVSHSL